MPVTHIPVSGRQINAADWAEQHQVELTDTEVTDALGYTPANVVDVASALATKSDVGHNHDERYYTEAEVDALLALLQPLPLSFNFTDDADAYFYADAAMTLTQQATIGAGSVAYEKSTTAAPTVFASTTSPISLQAGAWLKVVGTGAIAVALKRTA